MIEQTKKPSKIPAYIVTILGFGLLLSGLAAGSVYIGVPLFSYPGNILVQELGLMAAMFLGLICGTMAIRHGIGSIAGQKTKRANLYRWWGYYVVFALALGLGNLVLIYDIAADLVFPIFFLLGASMPTVAVISWVSKRLGNPVSTRQAWMAFISGSTLSIIVTIILGSVMFIVFYLLIRPLEFIAWSITDLLYEIGPGFLSRLFESPLILIFLIYTAIQAPFPEEFAKALGMPIFGRLRIDSERKAFMLGVYSGAGFAILENMLYESLYAQWAGWSWGGVTFLRGIGSILHPLGTGIVALGWYRKKEKGWGALLKAYMLAVVIHTLWNGGFEPWVYLTGLDNFNLYSSAITIYGETLEIVLLVYLVGLTAGLWWLMRRVTDGFMGDVEVPVMRELGLPTMTPRSLALMALGMVLTIVPIGAALGPAWPDILEVIQKSLGQ